MVLIWSCWLKAAACGGRRHLTQSLPDHNLPGRKAGRKFSLPLRFSGG
jgi:hypothetical protein